VGRCGGEHAFDHQAWGGGGDLIWCGGEHAGNGSSHLGERSFLRALQFLHRCGESTGRKSRLSHVASGLNLIHLQRFHRGRLTRPVVLSDTSSLTGAELRARAGDLRGEHAQVRDIRFHVLGFEIGKPRELFTNALVDNDSLVEARAAVPPGGPRCRTWVPARAARS